MSKVINFSNYKESKDDELVELDFNSFVKGLESGKYKDIKDLLKDYRNKN